MDEDRRMEGFEPYQYEHQEEGQTFKITVVRLGEREFFAYTDQTVGEGYVPRGYGGTDREALDTCLEQIKAKKNTTLPLILEPEFEEQEYDFFDPEEKRFYDSLREKAKDWLEGKIPPQHEQYTEYLLLIPDMFALLVRLLKDKRVASKSKVWLILAIGYFLSPIDLIPDPLFPVLGMLDDLAVGAYALNKVLNDTPPEVVEENWSGTGDILFEVERIIEKADELLGRRVVKGIKKIFERKKF